jgi:hypothetical protein
MPTEEDYNNLEQRLFALVNDMGLNFAKYSTLITNSAELNAPDKDYCMRYTEAKSVLDNIADWRRQTHSTPTNSAATATVTSTSVAPPVSVATSTVQTLTTKPPSIDGAKGPSLTTRVQTKTPYSAPSTSVPVSTYRNLLPISTSAPRNGKFSLPSFVASATGATPKGSYQPFFNPPDTTQMTKPTGVTTVTSSTANRTSVFPNVRSQTFTPQQTITLPFVKNIGSDCGTDFQGPRTCRQNKKRGNGQQQQQQLLPPQTQQQRQSPQFSDYQKKFEYMERQIAEQKRLLEEALKRKQPSKGPGDSYRNVPEQAGQTQGSASQPYRHSQPSQNQQPPGPEGRIEELPDQGRPPPFYTNYFAPRGNLNDGIYRPLTAFELAKQLVILFDHCGMTVQKFYSNSPLVCKNLD